MAVLNALEVATLTVRFGVNDGLVNVYEMAES
jgi:hypothetical protein